MTQSKFTGSFPFSFCVGPLSHPPNGREHRCSCVGSVSRELGRVLFGDGHHQDQDQDISPGVDLVLCRRFVFREVITAVCWVAPHVFWEVHGAQSTALLYHVCISHVYKRCSFCLLWGGDWWKCRQYITCDDHFICFVLQRV